jgi:hypothetical protein
VSEWALGVFLLVQFAAIVGAFPALTAPLIWFVLKKMGNRFSFAAFIARAVGHFLTFGSLILHHQQLWVCN